MELENSKEQSSTAQELSEENAERAGTIESEEDKEQLTVQELGEEYTELTKLIHDPRFFLLLGLLLKRAETEKKPSGFSSFFKHPAVLLVLGFFLTGWIGGALTNHWKSREWENQQHFSLAQKELGEKQRLSDESIRAIGETLAAADDMITIYFNRWTPIKKRSEIDERTKNWRSSSRKWRTGSEALKQRLIISFGSDTGKHFEDIVDTRTVLGVEIANLIDAGFSRKRDGERQGYTQTALSSRNKISKLTTELGEDLAQKMSAAVARAKPHVRSLWWPFE
jgi:hypothetical protein